MNLSENTGAPWRVGVLFSQTGVTSAIEQCQLNATLMAIEEINSRRGVLDRLIEPLIYDPASDPKQFRALAKFPLSKMGDSRDCPRVVNCVEKSFWLMTENS